MAKSVDPDEDWTSRSRAIWCSDLGLHCTLRLVCPNTYNHYGIFTKWAASWQNQQNDWEQPGHLPGLIRVCCALSGYLRTLGFFTGRTCHFVGFVKWANLVLNFISFQPWKTKALGQSDMRSRLVFRKSRVPSSVQPHIFRRDLVMSIHVIFSLAQIGRSAIFGR